MIIIKGRERYLIHKDARFYLAEPVGDMGQAKLDRKESNCVIFFSRFVIESSVFSDDFSIFIKKH